MEFIYIVLGLVMIYAWVHSIVIIAKKLKNPTTYEQVVLWVGLVAMVLYVLGTI